MITGKNRASRPHGTAGPSHRGFSLLELLVVVAILVVLLSILLPALMRARESSMKAMGLSNVRSLAQIITIRMDRNEGQMPTFQPGEMHRMPFTEIYVLGDNHWQMPFAWPTAMRITEDEVDTRKVFTSPGVPVDARESTPTYILSYAMSSSFIGSPELWGDNEISQERAERLRRGQFAHAVAHPSEKAFLWDAHFGWMSRGERPDFFAPAPDLKKPVAAFDGSAAIRNERRANAPARCWDEVQRRIISSESRYHNTKDGIRGRDW